MTQHRPLGVTVIAFYSLFFAVVSLPMGCVGVVATGAPGSGLAERVMALVVVGYGLFSSASAYGLWTFQRWGRRLSLWLYGAGIVLGVVAMLPLLPGQRFSVANAVFELVGIAINSAILSYLAGQKIRALFGESSPERRSRARQEPRF